MQALTIRCSRVVWLLAIISACLAVGQSGQGYAQAPQSDEASEISRRLGGRISAEGALEARPKPTGRFTEGSATFFGIQASGSRVVYLVDRSASMEVPEGLPFRAAKQELIASIEALHSMQQCYVIFYNQEVRLLSPTGVAGRLVFANDSNKRALADQIERIKADGATDHFLALRKALALQPDIIFVLTDADDATDLTSAELSEITARNSGQAAIYVVQFGKQYTENRLITLTEKNSGKHAYIDPIQHLSKLSSKTKSSQSP